MARVCGAGHCQHGCARPGARQRWGWGVALRPGPGCSCTATELARGASQMFFARVPRTIAEHEVVALFSRYGQVRSVTVFRAFHRAPVSKVRPAALAAASAALRPRTAATQPRAWLGLRGGGLEAEPRRPDRQPASQPAPHPAAPPSRPQGCGLVKMSTAQEAAAVIKGLDDKFQWAGMTGPMVVEVMDSNLQRQRRCAGTGRPPGRVPPCRQGVLATALGPLPLSGASSSCECFHARRATQAMSPPPHTHTLHTSTLEQAARRAQRPSPRPAPLQEAAPVQLAPGAAVPAQARLQHGPGAADAAGWHAAPGSAPARPAAARAPAPWHAAAAADAAAAAQGQAPARLRD
jgi:hypothetical protein